MTNFASPDYMGNCIRVGEVWRRSGRRRIGFIGGDLDLSISAKLRHMGLAGGLQIGKGNDVTLCMMEHSQHTEELGRSSFKYFTERMKSPPDAVYCMNAGVARGLIQVARKAGLRIPEDMSVVSDTSFDPLVPSNPNLTRFNEPLHEVGRSLLEMVCERIGKNEGSVTGRFFPAPLVGGGTTLPEENEFFGLSLATGR